MKFEQAERVPLTKDTEKEHPRDFGSQEAREMLTNFLPQFVPGIRQAEQASWYDNEQNNIDVVAYLADGKKLAIQWTVTDSPEKRLEKAKKLLKNPFIYLYDNEGEKNSEKHVPRILLYMDKKPWAEAWGKGGGDPLNAVFSLKDPYELGLKLADMICNTIEILLKPGEAENISGEEKDTMRQMQQFLRSKIQHLNASTHW